MYTSLIEHRKKTSNHRPFRQKARAVPYARRIFIERDLDRLLRLGIISVANPGQCLYSCLLVVVAKKEDILSICGDYRQLNQITINAAYQLPRID